jgi:hypothetical protein
MTDNLISEAARLMSKSKAGQARAARASRANGKLGGRPKGSKDSYQRTRKSAKRLPMDTHYEPIED